MELSPVDLIAKTRAALIELSCTGLYCEGECACTLDDLAPCGEAEIYPGEELINGCQPGYKFTDPGDETFWVVRHINKAPTADEWVNWRAHF